MDVSKLCPLWFVLSLFWCIFLNVPDTLSDVLLTSHMYTNNTLYRNLHGLLSVTIKMIYKNGCQNSCKSVLKVYWMARQGVGSAECISWIQIIIISFLGKPNQNLMLSLCNKAPQKYNYNKEIFIENLLRQLRQSIVSPFLPWNRIPFIYFNGNKNCFLSISRTAML
jgi:hypothetical protein